MKLTPAGQKVEYVMPTGSWFKRAYWRSPKNPNPLKADEYDDIRFNNPERYAITVPPADIANIRPMVEWEDMQAIVLEWDTSMFGATNASSTMASIAAHSATVAEVWIMTRIGQTDSIKTFLGKGR